MPRLVAADAEANAAEAYAKIIGLNPVRETEISVKRLGEALNSGYRLLHYAGHGIAGEYGEILPVTETTGLRTSAIVSLDGHRTPFVILSACEVGRGRQATGGRARGIDCRVATPRRFGCDRFAPAGSRHRGSRNR